MKRLIHISLRVSAGLFFAAAGAMKAIEPHAFISAITAFALIPEPFVRVAAFAVITGEMFFGTLLMLGIAPRAAGMVLITAMVLFTAAIISALVRGIELSCGCFGAASADAIGPWTILRNALIITTLFFIIASPSKDRDR